VAVAVRVVVLGGGGPRPGLIDVLGPSRAAALHELLVARAARWARAQFGEAVVRVAPGAPDASGWAAALGSPEPHGVDGEGRATLVLAPELGAWPPQLAEAVHSDLAAGCAVLIGPVFDGGAYLIGLVGSVAGAREAVASVDLAGRDAMTTLIGAIGAAGGEVGLLRSERGLRRAADVAALLADPLTDGELRALLAG
jgi:hypothetical protein